MQSKADIENKLKKIKPELSERFKVSKIALFGSYLHGDNKETSDIDLLVDLYEPIGWYLVDLKEYLESELSNEVDVVTINSLHKEMKEPVLSSVTFI